MTPENPLVADAKEPGHTLIGVDAKGDFGSVVARIMRSVQGTAREHEIVEVVQMDDSDISNYMREETAPFYRREESDSF